MCVIQDGKINRHLTRRFKIKGVFKADDAKCMEEVISRRIKHSIESSKGTFGNIPDLILVDGGIIQINAAKKALKKYDLNISIFGMVKDNKHKTKALINELKKEIELNDDIMKFITNVQDEVHNIAIEYNRKLRNKQTTKSILDEIEGVGEKRKQDLLKKFGSIDRIKKAKIEEISSIKGITEKIARKIKEKLDE